jgi:glycine dehydrogenase
MERLPQPTSTDSFVRRHIGPTHSQQHEMLRVLGHDSLDSLVSAAIPRGIHTPLSGLPEPLSETDVLAKLRELAERNRPGVSMIGLGYHPTVTPAVIRRNVLEDPSWYTAYTPYQPEISQGRLEALLNFQTMIADLTGLTTANASLLDEGTAAGEALTLIRRATRGKDDLPIVVDSGLLPQTRAVIDTRAQALGIELVEADLADGTPSDTVIHGAAGVVIAYPRADGRIVDPAPTIEAVHATGGLAAVVTDPLALVLLEWNCSLV